MIHAENLSFSYTGSPPYLLDGINLDIRAGEYVSIVGENGSGKSTLIRLILQFLKPTGGMITFQSKRIGYVPQRKDFTNLNFPITVYEVLNSYRKLLKIKDKGVIGENLEQVGMSAYAQALMGTLSGGQSQKIMIARALMGRPDLLILDEPSTGVDVKSQKEMYAFLRKLNTEDGITIVSVEHNMEAALANSTLIYGLAGGQGALSTPRQYADEYLETTQRDDCHVEL